jgi:hypothetical protein
MIYEALSVGRRPASFSLRAVEKAPPKRGFFFTLIDLIAASRQRRAVREIARLLALRSGKVTDDFERAIEQHLLRSRFGKERRS